MTPEKCYYCGKVKCECELPSLSWPKMRLDVTSAFRNGRKYDREMLNADELRAVLRHEDAQRERIVKLEREITGLNERLKEKE